MSTMRLLQDGPRVVAVLEPEGKVFFNMPWNQALEFARQITILARQAESVAKAEKIAFDQAVVLRAGLPFGFTNDPKIHDEARKQAAWNEKLRRWFRLPDHRRGVVGTPTLLDLGGKGDGDVRPK